MVGVQEEENHSVERLPQITPPLKEFSKNGVKNSSSLEDLSSSDVILARVVT